MSFRLKEDRIYGIIFLIILISLSLSASYILFRVLDSVAEIKSKSISLGGAIAGFFIIFKLLERSYYKVFAQESKLLDDIDKLKKENRELILKIGQLSNITIDCPSDYKTEISSDLKFGFAYPNHWDFIKSKMIDYGFIIENNYKTKKIVTNCSIVYIDANNSENSLDQIIEVNIKDELYETPNSKIISDTTNIINGLSVRRLVVDWIDTNKMELTGYLNIFIDELNQRFIKVTFTCDRKEFHTQKISFDNIANTFKIKHMV
jgi:hypothetical protein